jgi:hypothetical protein
VSIRRPLSRALLGTALLGGGALAVVGALALRGPGLVAVGLAATLAGCMTAGIVRESRPHTRGAVVESAVWAAGLTAGVVLVVAGIATIAGGVVAAIAVAAGVIVLLAVLGLRARGRRSAPDTGQGTGPARSAGSPPLLRSISSGDRLLAPVTALTTQALGEEWRHTTAALAGPLDPAARQSLVARREEALDELERRDAEGFALWLRAGFLHGSDPADFVRGGPARRGPVADTDAA